MIAVALRWKIASKAKSNALTTASTNWTQSIDPPRRPTYRDAEEIIRGTKCGAELDRFIG